MSRITHIGRDGFAPSHVSQWQHERAYRHEPLYARARPLVSAFLATFALAVFVAALVALWGLA